MVNVYIQKQLDQIRRAANLPGFYQQSNISFKKEDVDRFEASVKMNQQSTIPNVKGRIPLPGWDPGLADRVQNKNRKVESFTAIPPGDIQKNSNFILLGALALLGVLLLR